MAGTLDVAYLLEVAEDPETSVRENLAVQLAAHVCDDRTPPRKTGSR
jgi:hypothetical protein